MTLRWVCRKPYLTKNIFREELGTQKLKVAKLEEQNLEIPENSFGTKEQ